MKLFPEEFAVGSEPGQLQNGRLVLAIDQYEVWLHVAIAEADPRAAQRMVVVPGGQRGICNEEVENRLQVLLQRFAERPTLDALVVLAEAGGEINRPHSASRTTELRC